MWPHRRQPTRPRRPWDSPGKNAGVGCHFLLQFMKVKREGEVTQSCPTLSDPMDCSLPGSSVQGIFQARVLEWVAIAFSASVPLFPNICCYCIKSCFSSESKEQHVLTVRQKEVKASSLYWVSIYMGIIAYLLLCSAEDTGLIPGLGRCPGEGNGNPLQYSCLGNPMDRPTWQGTVHGISKQLDMTEQLSNNK